MKAMWQQGHHEVFYVVFHCKKTFYGTVPSFLLGTCPCCTLEEPGLEQGYSRLVACSEPRVLHVYILPWVTSYPQQPCTRTQVECHIPRLILGMQVTPSVHMDSSFPI